VQALDPSLTQASLGRFSERDAAVQSTISQYLAENALDALEINQQLLFRAPNAPLLDRLATFQDGLLRRLGLPLSGDDLQRMSGFEVFELLYESEEVRTTPAALGEFTGQWPLHRRAGSLALNLAGLSLMPVHTARGGSHALTHALVRCLVAHGGDVFGTCPVEKILVRDGRAHGVRLSRDALLPGQEIDARVVISNLTLAPTFLQMVGEDVIGPARARQIKGFDYDDPQLVAVHYALKGDPEFASAAWDPAVQRSWVGYLGGETLDEIRTGLAQAASGTIPDDVMGGYFLPTRAEPSQAPPGCHVALVWISVPPRPRRWRGRPLAGWDAWRSLAQPLADAVTDRMEQYAPGFRDLVLERHVSTPHEHESGNPSAIRGNMIGGSAIAEQCGMNRPLPGIVTGGAARSFLPGLYLSNSIHPYGATHLATGYLAAVEVAEDLGCRDVPWWRAQPLMWFLENLGRIPRNAGVPAKWQPGTGAGGVR
jgi:phytoene dehydrogenase-like protein